jgi:hypothetical protein
MQQMRVMQTEQDILGNVQVGGHNIINQNHERHVGVSLYLTRSAVVVAEISPAQQQ